MGDLPSRDANPQVLNRIRQHHVRETNLGESYPDRAFTVHELAAGAEVGAAVDATWGAPIRVDGYERITLTGAFTKGAAASIGIAVQSAPVDSDEQYADVYTDAAGDGALVVKVYTLTISASGRIVFDIPAMGNFMRFKMWLPSFNGLSAHKLQATRLMNAS